MDLEREGILCERCERRWVGKVVVPRFVPDGGEHVEEGRCGLGAIPGTDRPAGSAALLEASGVSTSTPDAATVATPTAPRRSARRIVWYRVTVEGIENLQMLVIRD
jgi:hypothetical protein